MALGISTGKLNEFIPMLETLTSKTINSLTNRQQITTSRIESGKNTVDYWAPHSNRDLLGGPAGPLDDARGLWEGTNSQSHSVWHLGQSLLRHATHHPSQ